ncbi:hypothetical protein BpHYR1_015053 [Brachionus plicatilis]|uniref:Uncharacterized protein n=1 Tax=Brachionus plicatilis TaxID=10195 RepID=A0A3M7PCS6_BRAPC|nr:hypothetical protein BpHYR1_015053 [Brachionus plicatilis]
MTHLDITLYQYIPITSHFIMSFKKKKLNESKTRILHSGRNEWKQFYIFYHFCIKISNKIEIIFDNFDFLI